MDWHLQMDPEEFRRYLRAMKPEDFESGLPYYFAQKNSGSFTDFSGWADIVEEEAGKMDIDHVRVSFLRTVYETVYYPNELNYIIRNGVKIPIIPPQNASDEAEDTRFHLEIEGIDRGIYTGDYVIDPDGVHMVNDNGTELTISEQPIIPFGIARSADGMENVLLWCSVYGEEKIITLPKGKVYDKKVAKEVRNAGVIATPQLAEYCQMIEKLNRRINPDFAVITAVSHLGWTDDSCTDFFPYDRGNYRLSAAKTESYGRIYDAVISRAGTFEEWRDLISQFRDEAHMGLRMVLAASFSSVLLKPMDKLPYVLHVWGSRTSGYGKTVALMVAASIWGKPDIDGGYIRSLNGTDNYHDQLAQFFCHLPLCLDELQTVRNKKQLEGLVYSLTEGNPRGHGDNYRRGMKDQNSWKNCAITTGEEPIISPDKAFAGALNRVIDFECTDYLFSSDSNVMSAFCIRLNSCYNTAGQVFLDYIRQEGVLSRALGLWEGFASEFNRRGVTGKQSSSAAVLLTADTLACECIFQDDLKLTVDDLMPCLKTQADLDHGPKMHQFVLEWIALNKHRFDAERDLGAIRKLAGRQVCCLPHDKFAETLKSHGYDIDAYKQWAVENGAILRDGDHLERKVMINGVPNVYCVCVLYEEPVEKESAEGQQDSDPDMQKE